MNVNLLRTWFWNNDEGRLRCFWRLCVQGVLFMGLVTVFLLGVIIAVPAARGLSFWTLTGGPQILVQVAIVCVAAIGSMWLAGRFIDGRSFADFGFHLSGAWWLDLGFGLALGAVLMTGVFLVEWAAGWVRVTAVLQTPATGPPFALAILIPLAVFVGVGIYEEMLFRGYLLRNLAEGFNTRVIGARLAVGLAWLLSSVLFGLGHLPNPHATLTSTAFISLAGLFLGLGYVLTGELAIPIGLHITWNFFQGHGFGFAVSGQTISAATLVAVATEGPDLWTGGPFGPEAGLMGVVAMAVGCLLMVLWVRFRYQRLALCQGVAQFRPFWA
ncbi:MAG: CPBP family intramembrane metalloprotease [Chloroflexaceae bacterium]|nr:CPBP family intramembrane metalloprotease [Chloroflexaceae bacterium]